MDQQEEQQYKIVVRMADGTEVIWLLGDFVGEGDEPYSWSSCIRNVLAASST